MQRLKDSLASLTQSSVESHLTKFFSYASRPLSEFNNFEALDMVEDLQHCAQDRKFEKEPYYRLVYQTAREKANLPQTHFRNLLLRLLGDKKPCESL